MAEGVAAPNSLAKRRFAAFISYAHADAAIAAKLQAKLERYRLPKHIAEAHTEGEAALGQIFRDREDLAAAPSLSDAIRAAISEAEALVVICSPDAKASRWVGEEIALFRQLHPDRPVLAAIVRGEPEEAFPNALTENGTEPLAADLRTEGDGEALGFLKIVAGIACVPLDALVQRDAQRRIRRVTWITAGALAAMLVMGIMTTLAIQARNEAARQRAEAEGLVEYMLTDLRTRLKGVGRLDVMTAVNKRAIDFYGRQGDLSQLPPDSLQRRARLLLAMGEDDEKRGDLRLALSKFREAHRATAAAMAQKGNDPNVILAHAQSEYWLGYGKQITSDPKGAIASYQSYLALAKQTVVTGLAADKGEREQGWAHNAMGVVFFEQLKDYPKAIAHFEQYRAIFERLWQRQPKDIEVLYSLADSYAWLAQVAAADKKLSAAKQHRETQIVILQKLFAIDPKNDQSIWAQIGAERELFRICFRQMDYRCSKASIARSKQLLNSRPFDRANRDWLWQSAYVALDSGFLAEKTGAPNAAISALNRAKQFSKLYESASEGDQNEVDELHKAIAELATRTS